MTITLRPHQVEAVNNLGNGKVLWGGVGSGKTCTALAYYVKKEAPKKIYVITTPKKRDSLEWEEEALKMRIGTEESPPGIGTITVDSWNNVKKYVDVEDAFFIFDEQRVVGRGAWVKSFLKITLRNRWILLTATPGDDWMDYSAIFIANGFFKNITQFRREHVVYQRFSSFPQISHYIYEDVLLKYKNLVLVEMPYERHTTRHLVEVRTEYNKEMMKRVTNDRWNPYEDAPLKDVAEMFRCMRRIAYEDPSRIAAIRELLEEHPKLIIFYNFNYELELLRGLREVTNVAEWNGQRKEKIPDTDSWVYLVQYAAGAEGWNCVETNAIVFYSMTYSYKNYEQAQGRIDRLNSPFSDLYYYILMSGAYVERRIKTVVEQKEIFNERKYASEFGF